MRRGRRLRKEGRSCLLNGKGWGQLEKGRNRMDAHVNELLKRTLNSKQRLIYLILIVYLILLYCFNLHLKQNNELT